MLDPKCLSELCKNSFLYSESGIKPGRLNGKQLSLQEAKIGKTKKGTPIDSRIVLGLDDKNNLIIIDGRHLLHAFVMLNKKIPLQTVSFDCCESERIFKILYPGSATS